VQSLALPLNTVRLLVNVCTMASGSTGSVDSCRRGKWAWDSTFREPTFPRFTN